MAAPPSRPILYRPRLPQLEVAWESRRHAFLGSLRAVFRGPKAPKGWPLGWYFRDSWVRSPFPTRALIASLLWHIVFIYFPFPMRRESRPRQDLQFPRIEVTWYGSARDLPLLLPPGLPARPSPPREPNKALPRRGADAYHPRQTIISSTPARPTHPRQTLIQPDAPPTPPKILPPLPNIVQWSESKQPAKPRLNFRPAAPKVRLKRVPLTVPVPEVPNLEKRAGELNIASSAMNNVQPRLPVAPAAAPRVQPHQTSSDAGPAPEIGFTAPGTNGDNGAGRLIALSTSPAEPAQVMEVPPGNLEARITISPEGKQPGVPGGAANGTPGGTGGPGGMGGAGGVGIPGPPSISITGGNPNTATPVAGPAGSPAGSGRMSPALPQKPEPHLSPTPMNTTRTPPLPAFDRIKPGEPPESLWGPKPVYTVHVNMPNLASATGSWVLKFVEFTPVGVASGPPAGPGDLAGPVPLRKVDPKYPPALMSAHVQGEVVLYAIIRKDGSVDSIQVLKGLDPELDQNAAEALARWKFRPAHRHGTPVELEAVVHIPFRAVAPF